MSFLSIGPGFYQMNSPDSILQAGGQGWSAAPWVSWGQNPNTAGSNRLATDGVADVLGDKNSNYIIVAIALVALGGLSTYLVMKGHK